MSWVTLVPVSWVSASGVMGVTHTETETNALLFLLSLSLQNQTLKRDKTKEGP